MNVQPIKDESLSRIAICYSDNGAVKVMSCWIPCENSLHDEKRAKYSGYLDGYTNDGEFLVCKSPECVWLIPLGQKCIKDGVDGTEEEVYVISLLSKFFKIHTISNL